MAGKYAITVPYLSDNPLSDEAEKAYIRKAGKVLQESLLKAADKLPKEHASVLQTLAQRAKRMKKISGMNQIFRDLEEFVDQEGIHLKYRAFTVPEGPREWSPLIKGIEDVPLPPNIPRPEMWSPEAVVQAVQDGFEFLLPFVMGEDMFTPNAYWIGGIQAAASNLTVGGEYTPEIKLRDNRWIQVKTFFPPEMVPEKAWLTPPNKNHVVPVHVQIDPDTIDWDLLNRGHQIRIRRGP